MFLVKLLSSMSKRCVVDARFKASKTVLLVRGIESAFFQIRQETLKGRYRWTRILKLRSERDEVIEALLQKTQV